MSKISIRKIIREVLRPFRRLLGIASPKLSPALKPFALKKLPYSVFEEIVKKHQGQPWFLYSYTGFAERFFATELLRWIDQNIPKDTAILEAGAGAGVLLYWLAEQGFQKLDAFDYDPATVVIANEIIVNSNYPIHYWRDNGLEPQQLRKNHYQVIYAIDWLYLREIPTFAMPTFLQTYNEVLQEGGVLLLELVDEAFNQVPWNRYHSSDRDKPVDQRRPSEYKLRFSSEEIKQLSVITAFKMIHTIDRTADAIPRKVYVLQKQKTTTTGDYWFRNDDVSSDTPLEQFKEFCSIFHRYGLKQLHGINLFGKTACTFHYNSLAVEYEAVPNLSLCENSRIRELAQRESFEQRTDLIEYLNSIPDDIALHGLYHVHYNRMTEEEQGKDFAEGLAILQRLFPQKEIRYFIAPFNEVNEDTYRAAARYGLSVLTTQNGIHFEEALSYVHLLPHIWYRYHHHRFYPESCCNWYALTLKKLEETFARNFQE